MGGLFSPCFEHGNFWYRIYSLPLIECRSLQSRISLSIIIQNGILNAPSTHPKWHSQRHSGCVAPSFSQDIETEDAEYFNGRQLRSTKRVVFPPLAIIEWNDD